jgi:predicted Zn-ribbon and HTH transcriptional regulator
LHDRDEAGLHVRTLRGVSDRVATTRRRGGERQASALAAHRTREMLAGRVVPTTPSTWARCRHGRAGREMPRATAKFQGMTSASRPRHRDLPERHATLRAQLGDLLREGRFTARDLSARIGISEKDVTQHLEHLARSAKERGERLEVEQPECVDCGFVFKDRTRLTRPSRCPRCKGERVAPPRYGIVSTGGRRGG